ncbi:hypothetical protein [Leptolyngbya iicbica]|uniref:hypothetical protein n=1 Tax=Leptolyngbya iicbica TaxID=3161580 RepID=UPI000693B541|nr:hypothetical protein [Leptolyngbya sp. LK]
MAALSEVTNAIARAICVEKAHKIAIIMARAKANAPPVALTAKAPMTLTTTETAKDCASAKSVVFMIETATTSARDKMAE